MTLYDQIQLSLTKALKERQETALSVWRGLKSAVETESKKGREINDELVQQIARSEIKRRHEAAALYRQAGEQERADQEEAEVAILTPLLPTQLDEATLRQRVRAAIAATNATGRSDAGRVMGHLAAELRGQADMSRVAALVQEALTGD